MSIIYKTTCKINNKIYIGQSKYNKNSYLGSGKIIISAILKYGKENFTKDILIDGDFTQDEIDNYEIKFIEEYNSTNLDIGYNIRIGGNGNTEKTNRLIAESRKGTIMSSDTKMSISKSKIGKKFSKEIKENMSKSKIGNKNRNGILHSQSDKIKISKGLKRYYEDDENRKKSSDIAKKRILDGKCLEGVKIISSKENQVNATILARLTNIKKVSLLNVIDNKTLIFESLKECSKFFGLKGNSQLIYCIKNKKLYRKIYEISY